MRGILVRAGFLWVFFCITVSSVYARTVPDLPRKELTMKIVLLLVGVAVVSLLCVTALNRLLYSFMGMEPAGATRVSLVAGGIFSFLWFLFVFGQIMDLVIKIAVAVLVVIAVVVLLFRDNEPPAVKDSGDNEFDGNY